MGFCEVSLELHETDSFFGPWYSYIGVNCRNFIPWRWQGRLVNDGCKWYQELLLRYEAKIVIHLQNQWRKLEQYF